MLLALHAVLSSAVLGCAGQVAIKKVLQDKRFKNRELQIMKMVNHPNIVKLKQCFYSTTEKDETYLHLVLEYVPDTVSPPPGEGTQGAVLLEMRMLEHNDMALLLVTCDEL